MNRILSTFVLAVTLLTALPVQAQLHFGVKGGLNISKVSFSKDVVDGDNRTGFFIGPMAEFTLPLFGLGFDVAALYNQSNTQVNIEGHQVPSESLKSVEIPVNLKWSFGVGSTLGAYVAAGPQFGFNVGKGHFMNSFDMKTCYTTFNIGAGVKLLRHIQAGITYNFGISKLANSLEDETRDLAVSMKKNTWQISLAYLF